MKNIRLSVAIIVFGVIILSSCSRFKPGSEFEANVPSTTGDTIALAMLKQNCMTCHSVTAASHDDLIAPPMIAVKRRYTAAYPNREDFIKHVVGWALKPDEKNAIMYGAVNRFKVMPYVQFKEKDLKLIAAYLYDNDIEKPVWFDAHFKEMHPDGN